MDKLIEFLKARLDEREALARAANPGPWTLRRGTGTRGDDWADVYARPEPDADEDDYPPCVIETEGGANPPNLVDAEHIAANDPAYVLADVAAKRQIVAMCEFLLETREVQEAAGELSDYSLGRAHAGGGVLRRLALPFAEHPDYREEWRV